MPTLSEAAKRSIREALTAAPHDPTHMSEAAKRSIREALTAAR